MSISVRNPEPLDELVPVDVPPLDGLVPLPVALPLDEVPEDGVEADVALVPDPVTV
jgi:hypothetical protein